MNSLYHVTVNDEGTNRADEHSIAVLSLGSTPTSAASSATDTMRTALLHPHVSITHQLDRKGRLTFGRVTASILSLASLFLFFSGIWYYKSRGVSNLNLEHKRVSDETSKASYVPSYLSSGSKVVELFDQFVLNHGKTYASVEEKYKRLGIFAMNLAYIERHNSGNYTYTLAPNEFADLSFDEFKIMKLRKPRRARDFYTPTQGRRLTEADDDDAWSVEGDEEDLSRLRAGHIDWDLLAVDEGQLPSKVDWRDRGCVTRVKDQKTCGSCWAFSAAGAVEAAYCALHGPRGLRDLSVQQMVDCGFPEGNAGCDGGEMDEAFQYVIDQGGLCAWDDYPYLAKDGVCHDRACRHLAKVARFADVPRGSEKALRAAIALRSPCSVGIEAGQLAFQFYHRGVFDAPCGTELDHGVLVVGYGVDEESGKDYWLVKNSWGDKWGEDGYIRLSRRPSDLQGSAGECGVLMEPSYPVVM